MIQHHCQSRQCPVVLQMIRISHHDLKWTLAWMWLALVAVEDKNHKEEHSVTVEIMLNVSPAWWLNHQSCWELWLILDLDLDVYIAETTSHYWSVSQQNRDSAMQTKVQTDYCQSITISTVEVTLSLILYIIHYYYHHHKGIIIITVEPQMKDQPV